VESRLGKIHGAEIGDRVLPTNCLWQEAGSWFEGKELTALGEGGETEARWKESHDHAEALEFLDPVHRGETRSSRRFRPTKAWIASL